MTYFEEGADDGEDHDREARDDDAGSRLASALKPHGGLCLYHVHAFIADTTGFMMAAYR